MVETPVLYIAYCRPEYARQSFNAIKRAKPKKLYFYSNIAREGRPDEKRRNDEVRAMAKEVDWDCEVKTYFREDYVDIFPSLWSAIDWVFENEEQAIVLEEDAVATQGFFEYCEDMLKRYKDEKDVWLISGNNFTPQYSPKGLDVFFSRYAGIWGWAGWKDRWERIDRKMTGYPTEGYNVLKKYFGSGIQAKFMGKYFTDTYKLIDKQGPWDRIFWYTCANNMGKFVRPKVGLVTNVETYGTNHDSRATLNSSKKIEAVVCNKFIVKNVPSAISFDNHYDTQHFWAYRVLGMIQRKFAIFFNKIIGK